jgi:hypothetical protein
MSCHYWKPDDDEYGVMLYYVNFRVISFAISCVVKNCILKQNILTFLPAQK